MSTGPGPSSFSSATTASCPPSTPAEHCGPCRTSSEHTSSPSPPTAARARRTSSGNETPSWHCETATSSRPSSAYAEHGRVTITATIDQARQQIVEDWWAVHHDHTTAILAVRRADVTALNDMVRARRQAGGELGEEIRIGDKAFSVGDRVIFEKNQRVAEVGQPEPNRAALIGPHPKRHVRHRRRRRRPRRQRCDQGG